MSARIIRPGVAEGEAGEARPIRWRVWGQPPAVSAPSRWSASTRDSAGDSAGEARPGTSASPSASLSSFTSLEDSQKEALAAAYQRGVAAGEAAAAQRAQGRLEPALAAFQSMAAELAALRKQLRREAEEAAVRLALAVARRVLHREAASDPEAILGLVKAAFQKCDPRESLRLRVSPEDATAIREHAARLNLPPGLEIVSDRNLARGSAIFETSRGDLDASVDTQLAEIERGFADLLKRRNS
jgi:flagellar assembly protein FliH